MVLPKWQGQDIHKTFFWREEKTNPQKHLKTQNAIYQQA